VGSGRMLLHASNFSFNLWGQDIDPLTIAMCKINGALYAPWLAFPLPARILGEHTKPLSVPLPIVDPSGDGAFFPAEDGEQRLLFPP
jgi:hypothetical protein